MKKRGMKKASHLRCEALWGEQDSNLRRLSQQIYSLPRLTASVSPRILFEPNLRFELRTPRLQITCSDQLS